MTDNGESEPERRKLSSGDKAGIILDELNSISTKLIKGMFISLAGIIGVILVSAHFTSAKEETCNELMGFTTQAKMVKELKEAAEEHCDSLKNTTHIAPDTFFEMYHVKDCKVGTVTTKECDGSATITITPEDKYGKQKPWKVIRRVGFEYDFEEPHGNHNRYSKRVWKRDHIFLPYITEKKLGKGIKSKWDKLKRKFSSNSSPIPLPRKFRGVAAPLTPKRSMLLKSPRKAC